MGDHDAISRTIGRGDRYKTKLLVITTSAFGAFGELEGQLLLTRVSGSLEDISQYDDNRARWTVCTASPFWVIWQAEKLPPVAVGSTLTVWTDRGSLLPSSGLPNQLTRSPVKKRGVDNILTR